MGEETDEELGKMSNELVQRSARLEQETAELKVVADALATKVAMLKQEIEEHRIRLDKHGKTAT